MQATNMDLAHNLALVGWMMNMDATYCSRFTLQCLNENRDFARSVEKFIEKASLPENFENSGRFSRQMWMTTAHYVELTGGDIFAQKLNTGRLVSIEPDRVRVPNALGVSVDTDSQDFSKYINGCLPSARGGIAKISVCNRTAGGGYEFAQIVNARNFFQIANFHRFDGLRGVSPLAPAMSLLMDTFQLFDYSLARAKLAQMFGLVITRTPPFEDAFWQQEAAGTDEIPEVPGEETDDDGNTTKDEYAIDLAGGPFIQEMGTGDKVDWINSNVNANDTGAMIKETIIMALKCLGIPAGLYYEDIGNYYQIKVAVQNYFESCETRRETKKMFLRRWSLWRLKLAILNDEFELPTGMTLADVRLSWVPKGGLTPDRLRDLKADELEQQTGQTSTPDLSHRKGEDAIEIAERQAAYDKEVAGLRKDLDTPTTGSPPITPDRDSENRYDPAFIESVAEAVADEMALRSNSPKD